MVNIVIYKIVIFSTFNQFEWKVFMLTCNNTPGPGRETYRYKLYREAALNSTDTSTRRLHLRTFNRSRSELAILR